MKIVSPVTFVVGMTVPDTDGLLQYLRHTGQTRFLNDWQQAMADGVKPAEALVSCMSKLCYSSLVPGKNENLTSTRAIGNNVRATIASGHGSVLEHIMVNFITTDCSRVFTHELVRHRAGTAFSQTSGRYVRTDELKFVHDPILDPVVHEVIDLLELIEQRRDRIVEKMGMNKDMGFDEKKKLTSAIRRMLPNGLANEIGWSANIRTLRHLIQLRTSKHAEWEIRRVFCDVFAQLQQMYPLLFADAIVRYDDVAKQLFEVTGMTMQPYGEHNAKA